MFGMFEEAHALLELATGKRQRRDLSAPTISSAPHFGEDPLLHMLCKNRNTTTSDNRSSNNISSSDSDDRNTKRARKEIVVEEEEEQMVGSLTMSERKIKVNKYLVKRARRIKNRLEGKSHQYAGRTKFANARRRVKGRFVTLEFMSDKGIKYDSEKTGWVCATLGNKVFPTADEAVRAVDAGTAPVAANANSTVAAKGNATAAVDARRRRGAKGKHTQNLVSAALATSASANGYHLEFLSGKGIKFDSENTRWVCSTLDNKFFPTADEAVRAVAAGADAAATAADAAVNASAAVDARRCQSFSTKKVPIVQPLKKGEVPTSQAMLRCIIFTKTTRSVPKHPDVSSSEMSLTSRLQRMEEETAELDRSTNSH